MRKIDESKAANKQVGGNSLTHKTSKSRLDEVKLAELSTTNKMLDDKYGTHGTESRNEFDEQSLDIVLSTLYS